MHVHIAVGILLVIPPVTGITLILLDHAHPPRLRSTLALGTTVLLAALGLAILGSASAVLDGRQPFIPYLVMTGVPALTVARMMQLEFRTVL
jgi:hypothetical protein